MTSTQKQNFTYRITQANKTGLVVILYDMALVYMEDAKKAFAEKDMTSYKNALDKAKGCIEELLHSLHPQYELALHLQQLYYFYKRQLSTAAIRQQVELIDPIYDMISQLKESFEKIMEIDTSESLMENSQVVYAGLTYGKGSLNENLASGSSNRGFLV